MFTLDHVRKTYRTTHGTVTALEDVSLRIADGEWVAIQGPTGGGKSTLLQLLGGLDRPSAGEILFDDTGSAVRLDRLPEAAVTGIRRDRIGFVFQAFNLIPTLSALDNVAVALRPSGTRPAEARARASAALERVGLDDRADHLPAALSGGQQQRVAIARALVKEPDVILADEPTGNLDERTRDEVIALLSSIRADRGITLVVVTHDSDVAAWADRILTIEGGGIRETHEATARAE